MSRALVLLMFLACVDEGGTEGPMDTGPSGVPAEAEVRVVTVGASVPLARRLEVTAARPVRVEASWGGRTVDFQVSDLTHTLPLVGFLPDSTTPLTITLTDEDGGVTTHAFEVVTEPLPTTFPSVEVLALDPARVQPGYTLVAPRPANAHGERHEADYIVLLDEHGRVVWYHAPSEPITDASMLPNGHLLTQVWSLDGSLGGSLAEIDLLGNEIRRWHGTTGGAGGVDDRVVEGVEGFHHEGRPTPWGTYLTLTKEPLSVPNYPTSYTNPEASAPATVGADVAVEFDASGAVVNRWPMADHLDPTRVGFMSIESSSYDGLPDWTHANAVTVDPLDDAVVLSLRNQSALVKLTRAGDLVWILGDPADWAPAQRPYLLTPVDADMAWFYYQHDPSFRGDGRVVVFDNGVERVMPHSGDPPLPTAARYTRVVEYQIDAAAGTVAETWAYEVAVDGVLFSEFAGGTEYLANGNVLACYGYVSRVDGVPISLNGFGALAVRLVEIAPGPNPEPVLDVRISTREDQLQAGVSAYRAERVATLYPQFGPPSSR